MSTTNYPFLQDTSFESFTIIDEGKQNLYFGRTYGQADLLPLDMGKIARAYIDGTLVYPFLRQFSVTFNYIQADFNDEVLQNHQGQLLGELITMLYDYYTSIMSANKIALGVCTEIKSTIQHKGGVNDIQLTYTAKVVWFGPSFCDYV